jgi:hypothetical protein
MKQPKVGAASAERCPTETSQPQVGVASAERRPSEADPPLLGVTSSERYPGRLSQAIDEFYAAIDAGQIPDRDALLAKYADVADELSACLASLDFIQNVAPQLAESRSVAAATDPFSENSALRIPNSAFSASLGDFQILREIGRGGMGIVYEAEQLSLGRKMALKVLPFAATLDKQRLKRFQNEARAAATLDHPNIVAVHSVGEERGVHYYAMQLVEGQSLAEVIAALRESRDKGQETRAGGMRSAE